jgi:hypothetical protein
VGLVAPKLQRGPIERLWAWVVTGPLGHLYGTAADVIVLWARYARHRIGRSISSAGADR